MGGLTVLFILLVPDLRLAAGIRWVSPLSYSNMSDTAAFLDWLEISRAPCTSALALFRALQLI